MMYVPLESARPALKWEIRGSSCGKRTVPQGFLRQRSATSDDVHAPLADHLQLDYALRRRGLALAMADLVDWQVHEKLHEDLMASLARTPPPGYAKVDLGQVRGAYETAFQLLARLSVHGIRRLNGKRPLDELIPQILGHRDHNMALQPLPGCGIQQHRPAGPGAVQYKSFVAAVSRGRHARGGHRPSAKKRTTSKQWHEQSKQRRAARGTMPTRRGKQEARANSCSATGLAVSWMRLMATTRQFALHSTSKVAAQEARQEHVVNAVDTCVSCVRPEPIMAMCVGTRSSVVVCELYNGALIKELAGSLRIQPGTGCGSYLQYQACSVPLVRSTYRQEEENTEAEDKHGCAQAFGCKQ